VSGDVTVLLDRFGARTPAMTPSLPSARQPNPFAIVGFGLLLLYIYLALSRVLDFTLPQLRIPMILYILLTVAGLMNGGLIAGLSSKIGVFLLLHILWVAAAVPFSVWVGGSASLFIQILRHFILFCAIVGLTNNLRQSRRLLTAAAFAFLTAALLSFVVGHGERDRLGLTVGNLTDPNEYALILLIGLSLWLWLASQWSGVFKRCIVVGAILAIVGAFARTGSRSGLITLLAMAVILFLRTSLAGKVKLGAAVLAGTLLAGLLLPDNVRQRFVTFFTVDSDQMDDPSTMGMADSAVESTESRLAMLRESLSITFRHPIFGVGPNQFPVYTDQEARERGARHGTWLVTHNTYTQISSECGIPAIVFYAAAMGLCMSIGSRLRRHPEFRDHPSWNQVWNMAFYLRLCVVAMAVFAFFLCFAYTALFYIMAALAVSFERVAFAELSQPADTAPVPQPQRGQALVPGLAPR
jgi:O-antigen ligase